MEINKKICFLFCLGIIFLTLISCKNPGDVYQSPVFAGFAALDNSNNRIIFIGDTQGTSLLEFWREDNKEKTLFLLADIARRNPAAVINLGDLVFCGTSQKQWEFFDEAHQPLLEKNIPYFPLPGNHEYWCSPGKSFKNYFSRFPHLNKRKWYSFRFQTIGFLVLDSNFSRLSEEDQCNQVDWYYEELFKLNSDSEIDYIIVCCHNPPYTNSTVVKPGEKELCCFLKPFLRLRKTAAFFSGHCHSYEKFKKNGKYFIVSGGGGGPRQKLIIDKEKRRFNDLFAGPSLRFLNFCQVTVEPGQLCIQVIKLNHDKTFALADEFTIPKS